MTNIKKIVMYSIDLEPLSIEDFKCLIDTYVGSRVATNSIFIYESIEEKEIKEEWHDNIVFNLQDKQLNACKKLFEK